MTSAKPRDGDGKLVHTNSGETARRRGGGWYAPSGRLWQRGRALARGAARWAVERSPWQLALAVWLTHGLLDGVVTIGIVAYLEDTTIESNPIVEPHLASAHLESVAADSLLPYLEPLALKLVVVAVAAGLLVVVDRAVPRRVVAAFATAVSGLGLVVVVNNLVGFLALVGWSA